MNPERTLNRVLLSVGLLVGSLLGFQGCATAPAPSEAAAPLRFRVMTFNIHHGEGLDGKVDLARLAEVIRQEGADLVALQEVDKGVARTARRDLPQELARLTGMTAIFANNHSVQGGEYGNAILTRFPVRQWTNSHYRMLRPGEQRGLLQAELDVQGRPLVFMATHIDYRADDSERWANVGEIEAAAARHAGRPVILAGDFNDIPDSRVCRRLAETFTDTWARVGQGEGATYPAEAPRRRIDYLWVGGNKSVAPLKAWVPATDASDHRPVVAEFSAVDLRRK